MDLLEPLAGTYCAATVLIIKNSGDENYTSVGVFVNEVCIKPENSSWGLAKLYVLQGAAYHVLFVVHPAIHFPLDSVNAITRSAVPIAHPLFQLLHPHSCYQLALDNAVLEGARSVVNNDAKGTRYDPLTANGYNLKLLFGAGYTGLPEGQYNNAYPVYDYMQPQMGFASDYGRWLAAYFAPFLKFTTAVAEHIRNNPHLHEYARRWAHYNHAHVLGFPEAQQMEDRDTLAKTMAIFMWDASVAHGADHWSFSNQISVVEKCLRIRRPPPKSADEPPVTQEEIFSKNDLKRAAVCQHLFFEPWAIKPNLSETRYAFTDNELEAAAKTFQQELRAVSQRTDIRQFMPLTAQDDYKNTIPQSIQY